MALPSGYSRLRYIQSSGTQYIDTGFKPNNNTRVVIDLELGTQSSYPKALIGGRNGDTSAVDAFTLWAISASSFRTDLGTGALTIDTVPNGRFLIDKNKTAVMVNNDSYANEAATFQSNYNLGIFTQIDVGGPDTRMLEGKVYSCQVYDNGTLVRDFVPAIDSSGTIGLYDLVNNTFYGNAGTGSFTAGPMVTGPVDGVGVCIINAASFAINAGKCILNGAVKEITEGMTLTAGTAKKIALKSGIDVAAMAVSYSGTMTDVQNVSMGNGLPEGRLLILDTSGTLTLEEKVRAIVWMCNGGNGGSVGYVNYTGGGGGYVLQTEVEITEAVTCLIGSGGTRATASNHKNGYAGGSTYFGTITPKAQEDGGNGASGGGSNGGGAQTAKGSGEPTMPFSGTATEYPWMKYHSAGGGGGSYSDREEKNYLDGYDGGSNGSDGKNTKGSGNVGNYADSGAGGELGGGNGGENYSTNGYDATWYGSGGGQGGNGFTTTGSHKSGSGGTGYQGRIYVLIPYEQ